MQCGLLLAFEGIDGTGKSTQIQILAQKLQEQGRKVVLTREPSDSIYGQRIRQLYTRRDSCTPAEELELFLQDRRLHVQEVIQPALVQGRIVLTDRYYYSTVAYQGAAGMDPADILARHHFAPKPDLVFLLTMQPELSLERIRQGRGEQPNAFEQLDNLRKVAQIFATLEDTCIRRIDASQAVEAVQAEIQAALAASVQSSCPGS